MYNIIVILLFVILQNPISFPIYLYLQRNMLEFLIKVPISLACRLRVVGDVMATQVSGVLGHVSWVSRYFAVKSNMFDFFLRLFRDLYKYPVGLGDVAATSKQLNLFSTRDTSQRRLYDVSETCLRPMR